MPPRSGRLRRLALTALFAVLPLAGCETPQLDAVAIPWKPPVVVALAPPTLAPPTLEPGSMVGLDGGQLEGRLGLPDYRRVEDTVQVWQYRLENCVVDFVLYPDDSVHRITAWNGRHRVNGRNYDHDACSRELVLLEGRQG